MTTTKEKLHSSYIKKLNSFLPKIKEGWVAGGAVTSIFTNKLINDYDIYFSSKAQFEKALEYMYDNNWWCASLTRRCITFKKGLGIVQLMFFSWFDSAEDIFKSFDFTVCMGAFDISLQKFILHDTFLEDNSSKILKFNYETKFPLASGLRVLKYQEKGYSISKEEFLKVLIACNLKSIGSWEELKDQVGGSYGDLIDIDSSGDFNLNNAVSSFNPENAKAIKSVLIDDKDLPANFEEAVEMIGKIKTIDQNKNLFLED